MPTPDTVLLSARLPVALVRALDARAKRDQLNRSEVLRSLLAWALEEVPGVERGIAAILHSIEALRADVAAMRGARR
jgi:metal-responsive CopG/Arc/MetJ family transcriptional regulator